MLTNEETCSVTSTTRPSRYANLAQGQDGTFQWYMNVAEAVHPEYGHYLMFMDSSADGNLDGIPDFVLVILRTSETTWQFDGMQPEKAMSLIEEVAIDFEMDLEDMLHKASKLNFPKDWAKQEAEANKFESNDTADEIEL